MLRAWKSPLREAIASNRKQQGYILVEILAAVAIFLFAVGTLFIQANKWQEYCYKNQVRLVAHILAADLREIQERALFKGYGIWLLPMAIVVLIGFIMAISLMKK